MRTENTFEGGMHIDNDFSKQPKGTYRLSRNGYVFSIGENNFVWTIAKGTLKVNDYPSDYKPIGIFSAREKLIIFSINTLENLAAIGWLQEINSIYIYTPIYIRPNTDLEFSLSNLIKGYSYFENTDTERIYWSDENTKPKTLNLSALTFGMNFTLGKKYLVLEGTITHDVVDYTAGDAFVYWETSGFGWTLESSVIEYFEPEILDWHPDLLFERISKIETIEGNLNTGHYYFTYRFITEFDNATPWAPLSRSHTIMKTNGNTVDPSDYPYVKNWNYIQGSNDGSTENGIRITLENIPYDKYKYVQFASFKVINDLIETGVIFSKLEINKVRTSEVYPGYDYRSTIEVDMINYTGEYLTTADYVIQSISLLKINDLDIIKDIQSVSGTTEEGDIGISNSMPTVGEAVKTCVYEIPADVLSHSDYDNDKPLAGVYDISDDGRIASGNILQGQWYKVVGSNIVYDSIPYNEGDYFIGTNKATFAGATTGVEPVMRICKYIDNTGTAQFEYINMDDAVLPKGNLSKQAAGYWGKETYRLAFLPISLTGKFLPARFIEDYTIPERSLSEEVNEFDSNGNLSAVYNQLISGPHVRFNAPSTHEQIQYNTRIDSLLITANLTDIIDEISGFCIVRSVRNDGIISEGFVEPIIEADINHHTGGDDEYEKRKELYRCRYINPGNNNNFTGYHFTEILTKKYCFTSPSTINGKEVFIKNDSLKLVRVYEENSDVRNNNYIKLTGGDYTTIENDYNVVYELRCLKLYNEINTPVSETETVIISDKEEKDINSEWLNTDKFINGAIDRISYDGDVNKYFIHYKEPANKTFLLTLNDDREWFDGTQWPTQSPERVYIVEHKSKNTTYSSDVNNLGLTEYILTGHYQPITSEFKAAIKYGNEYIAKDIQIFGGDTYVNLFGISRIPITGNYFEGEAYHRYEEHFGDYIIVPIQSKINTSTVINRNGQLNNIGPKDGSSICSSNVAITDNIEPFPPNYKIISKYLESNLYQESSYVDSNQIKYPGLAPFASINNVFENRIRNSIKKQVGFAIDEFLDFPALNYLDIPGNNGSITNIIAKGSRLFVWQENGIGYVSVSEKALISGEANELTSIGTGSAFKRYDIIHETFGNQDKFGLVESDRKWYWFDYYRKVILSMSFNGKLNEDSVIKGMDSYFQENLPLRKYLNVRSGYDPKMRVVHFTFIDQNVILSKTISINTKSDKFNGEHDFVPSIYTTFMNELFTVKNNDDKIYIHNRDSSSIYGQSYESQLSFIVNNNDDEMKKFMSAIFRGGREFFNTVKYETLYDFDSELFLNTAEDTISYPDYEFVIDEWRAGIPEGYYGRMDGRYMLVTLKVTDIGSKARLAKMITNYLKQH